MSDKGEGEKDGEPKMKKGKMDKENSDGLKKGKKKAKKQKMRSVVGEVFGECKEKSDKVNERSRFWAKSESFILDG